MLSLIQIFDYCLVGSVTCPVNNVNLVRLSLIKNKKGRLQIKNLGNDADLIPIAATVAAAASVPTSFTSIKAFWRTGKKLNALLTQWDRSKYFFTKH